MSVEGNGASMLVQKRAGVPEADLLIAATSADEVNMLACLLGKKLGVPHTIARVRNPEYYEQINELKEELGLKEKIEKNGWKSLTSRESGAMGGKLSGRMRKNKTKEN